MVDERLVMLGEHLIDQVIELGVNGGGPLSGAAQIADEHLIATDGDRDAAVRRLVASHVRLAAVSGFVTGIGGIVTLPIAVPAATAGLYVLATRMSAGIAHLRGYDIGTAEVRSAVVVSLLGSAGASVLRRAGVQVGRRSAAGVLGLGKLVPFVGGPIGATVDALSCRTIATYAKHAFPSKMSVGHPVVDGEIMY